MVISALRFIFIFSILLPRVGLAEVNTANLVEVMAIKLQEVLRAEDISRLARLPGVSQETKDAYSAFLAKHSDSARDYSKIEVSTLGSTLMLSHQGKTISLNFFNIGKKLLQINGVAIQISENFEKVYSNIERSLPKSLQSSIFELMIPTANAGWFDKLKVTAAAVTVFTLETYQNMPASGVVEVLLHPQDEGDWILENFNCGKDGVISYKMLALSSKARSKNTVDLSFSFIPKIENGKNKLIVQGYGCEKAPFIKESENQWKVPAYSAELHKNVCPIEAKKYNQLKICCENKTCENEMQARINEQKTKYSKDYEKIDPQLKTSPGTK